MPQASFFKKAKIAFYSENYLIREISTDEHLNSDLVDDLTPQQKSGEAMKSCMRKKDLKDVETLYGNGAVYISD